ncbi:hypothetical protein BJV82DRAFT_288087 [Fennellomyces sp. T-0311]|nr:hypothetical protein BJV82DRAFT_288087 [Fennellomyces sp. T-0311]
MLCTPQLGYHQHYPLHNKLALARDCGSVGGHIGALKSVKMPKILFDEEGLAIGGSQDLEIAQQSPIVDVSENSDESDDEAPEAISTSTAKATVLQNQKIKNEMLARAAAKDKERRRQQEEWLKEQKQGSKREQKQKRKQVEEVEEVEEEDEAAELQDETQDNDGLLPAELLAQAAQEKELAKAETHLRAEDFERLAAEMEVAEQKKEQRKKRRKTEAGMRQVGEYTVKVLSKRPRAPVVNEDLRGLKDSQQIHRKGLPRKAAILQRSEKLVGKASLQFRRQ